MLGTIVNLCLLLPLDKDYLYKTKAYQKYNLGLYGNLSSSKIC